MKGLSRKSCKSHEGKILVLWVHYRHQCFRWRKIVLKLTTNSQIFSVNFSSLPGSQLSTELCSTQAAVTQIYVIKKANIWYLPCLVGHTGEEIRWISDGTEWLAFTVTEFRLIGVISGSLEYLAGALEYLADAVIRQAIFTSLVVASGHTHEAQGESLTFPFGAVWDCSSAEAAVCH